MVESDITFVDATRGCASNELAFVLRASRKDVRTGNMKHGRLRNDNTEIEDYISIYNC